MLEALKVDGVLSHLPTAIALLVLGVLTVRYVLKGWTAFLGMMQRLVTAGIDAHVEEHHAGDEAFKREVRDGFKAIGDDIRAVHDRIDRFLERDLEDARRRREG